MPLTTGDFSTLDEATFIEGADDEKQLTWIDPAGTLWNFSLSDYPGTGALVAILVLATRCVSISKQGKPDFEHSSQRVIACPEEASRLAGWAVKVAKTGKREEEDVPFWSTDEPGSMFFTDDAKGRAGLDLVLTQRVVEKGDTTWH